MVAGGDDGLSLRRVGLQWLRRQWLKNRCHASSFSLSANGGFLTKERRALSVMYNSPFILPGVSVTHTRTYSFMVFLSVELLPPVSSKNFKWCMYLILTQLVKTKMLINCYDERENYYFFESNVCTYLTLIDEVSLQNNILDQHSRIVYCM